MMLPQRRKYSRLSLLERFSRLYDATSGCWIWLAFTDKRGYGRMGIGHGASKGMKLAHRVAYELFVGPIPKGHAVCHRCDNPSCVRPAHLFAATQADNLRDMWVKGRAKLPESKGEKNGNAKITWETARAIRHLYFAERRSQQEIADFYCLDQTHVSQIVRRMKWA
jgi:hypothetical protein